MILAITPISDKPKSITKAMCHPDAAQWSAAVKSELGNLTGKGTWEEAVLPAGRKMIGCKWVLKTKTDVDGNIIKYKARLVAQGFSQQPGINFEETFAPVGRSTSLWILLTLAAAHNLEIHQADVEGAYLNNDLDRHIYMKIPQAYNQLDPSCNALKLRKTLYGLKQSGCKWWKVLGEALNQIGFKRCENEWGMYVLPSSDGSPKIILLAYVDDLVLAARTISEIDSVLASLAQRWVISKLGPVFHILGTKVTRNQSHHILWLTQTAYIYLLMQRFPGFSTSIAKHSPLLQRAAASAEDNQLASLTPYQELVGRIKSLLVVYSGSLGLLDLMSPIWHLTSLDSSLRQPNHTGNLTYGLCLISSTHVRPASPLAAAAQNLSRCTSTPTGLDAKPLAD